MKITTAFLTVAILSLVLLAPESFGRGFGGGGRSFSGGGFGGGYSHGGGYGGGGQHNFGGYGGGERSYGGYSGGERSYGGYGGGERSYGGERGYGSSSYNRSPSMSRSSEFGGDRSEFGSSERFGGGNSNPFGSGSRSYERPSQNELSGFLGTSPQSAGSRSTGDGFQSRSYRQGDSITAAQNQWGTTAVSARGGYGYGNGTGKVGAVAAVRGPGGNTVVAGRGTTFVNGQYVGGRTWTAVNGAYTRWGCFTPDWYGRYPGAWWPGRWAVATTAWATAAWTTAGTYCGCAGDGTYYDYGNNVTYQDDTVYYGNQPVATADQYYGQADQLADSGQTAQNEDWLPLGVFALTSDATQTNTEKTLQLAVNKEGVIRGNLHDTLIDKVIPVTGAVDKKTQRVAVKMEGNDSVVMETGLYNLTNDEVPVLLHFSADRQEKRTLIRLKPPADQTQQQ